MEKIKFLKVIVKSMFIKPSGKKKKKTNDKKEIIVALSKKQITKKTVKTKHKFI